MKLHLISHKQDHITTPIKHVYFYPVKIQVRQKACNGARPSCNCGVAIRENLFYKTYDMCYVTPGRPWWENNVRSRLRIHQLRDFKLSRFYSSISPQGGSAKFEVGIIVCPEIKNVQSSSHLSSVSSE